MRNPCLKLLTKYEQKLKLLWPKVALPCKQVPINSPVIFELWLHFSFEAWLLPRVVAGVILSSDNLFDFYVVIVSISPVGIEKVLEIGWNTN